MKNFFVLGAAVFAALNLTVAFPSLIDNLLHATFEEIPTYNDADKRTISDTVGNAEDTLRDGDDTSKMYHLDFNQEELADIFGCHHYADVPKYYPAVVSGIRKLSLDEHHQVTVKTLGKNIKMNLSKNEKNIPDTHTTEIFSADGKISKNFTGVLGEFSIGHVEGDEHSHVGFHHNGRGISGYLSTHNDMLIIKPLPRRVQKDDANHIVYRLFDFPEGHPINQHVKFIDSTSEDGINIGSRRRRSVDTPRYPKKTMELMIVADWKMLEYYGEDVLPQYILNVGNVVAGFFRDPSLEYPIDIVVTRTVIWETDMLQATGTSDQLTKFRDWVRLNNDFNNDANPKHVDVAFLLSRDGCIARFGICGLEGLAYVAMCRDMSVGVSRDRGLMSSTTMAHEIGHILGAAHDDVLGKEACPGGTFIMSSGSVEAGEKGIEWSPCTSDTFKESLSSSRSSCFDDVPSNKLTDSHYQLYGQVYNASQQCKFVNKESDACDSKKLDCKELFCSYKGKDWELCKTGNFVQAHGTECGDRKWCIRGHCIPDGTFAERIDGGWSTWSYTECSRPCGVGVQWRERSCNAPEPANGGAWCDPTSKERGVEKDGYRTCNKQNCIKDESTGKEYLEGTMFGSQLKDLNVLCSETKNGGIYCIKSLKHSPCQLICKQTYASRQCDLIGDVHDGTACTMGERNGVCIHGECVERGCDLEINSAVGEDRCGKCGGNGDYCERITGKDDKKHKSKQWILVTVIPEGAFDIKLSMTKKHAYIIGVSYHKRANLQPNAVMGCMTGRYKNNKKEFKSFQFVKDAASCKLIIKQKAKKNLVIWIYTAYRGKKTLFTWEYLKTLTEPEAFVGQTKWWSGEWKACTKTCGNDGKRNRDVLCHREDATVVNPSKCSPESQPALHQPCNRIDCPASWVISGWSTCATTGERTRTIKCVSLTKDGVDKVVDDSECATPKPTDATTEVCDATDCNPRWEIKSEFGACTKRCGREIVTRKVECWRLKKDGSDKKEPYFACDKLVDSKPATSKVCNADKPCPSWSIKNLECSATCGDGKQLRAVVCASQVQEFDDSWCTGPKPTAPTLNCNVQPCTGNVWRTYYGECSRTCGGGQMPVYYECKNIETGEYLENDDCDDHTKPLATTKSCNSDVCPKTHIWKVTYAECTVICGGGTQSSIPHCYRTVDDKEVEDNDCDMTLKPAVVTQPCNTHKCTNTDYEWEMRWTSCSVTCGDGSESSEAICIHKVEEKESSEDKCVGQTKPGGSTRACNLGTCPPITGRHYAWYTKDLGCSVDCGEGYHSYELQCRQHVGSQVTTTTPDYCDESKKPTVAEKACEGLPACFKIKVHHGFCDAKCGKGEKIRELTCESTTTQDTVAFTNCNTALLTLNQNEETKAQPCTGECSTTNTVLPGYSFTARGCFYNKNHDLPMLMDNFRFRSTIDWHNMTNIVLSCYNAANSKGYKYFGLTLKDYGECWAGSEDDGAGRYKKPVTSTWCHCVPENVGIGTDTTIYVYHIGSDEGEVGGERLPPVITMGCYEDSDVIVDAQVGALSNSIDKEIKWDQEKWDSFIGTCALGARENRHAIFAVNNSGDCFNEEQAAEYKRKTDFSISCIPATMGVRQYFVFKFQV